MLKNYLVRARLASPPLFPPTIALSGKLDIFLELIGAAEGSHMPKSA
jgi:hypothetical protein